MKNWLVALFSEWVSAIWLVLSVLSTLCTFFIPSLAGNPRIVSVIALILGFAWANFRVFQKQERRISTLLAAVDSQAQRKSQLRISPQTRSRYILRPVNNVAKGDFNGGWLEFQLMVENVGSRNSIINRYDVEIVELKQTFANLSPTEGQHRAQGRHCVHGIDPQRILSRTGIVNLPAESATNRGALLFWIPELDLKMFANARLTMSTPERKFSPLHCLLTITDTSDSSATGEFELSEQ